MFSSSSLFLARKKRILKPKSPVNLCFTIFQSLVVLRLEFGMIWVGPVQLSFTGFVQVDVAVGTFSSMGIGHCRHFCRYARHRSVSIASSLASESMGFQDISKVTTVA